MHGRFAPAPTGDLHLGNLRTALAAWLLARSAGSRFVLRFEDLDRGSVREEYYDRQRRDLERLGLDHDGPALRQSDRDDAHAEAIASLQARGLTYRCWCTRREIREAATAPQASDLPEGAYPGTCRELTAAERRDRERGGRPASLRLDARDAVGEGRDRWAGVVRGPVDDVVLRRHDGTAAYHLAVVVDDAHQGVQEVVRGDDLLESVPRQAHLAALLGLPPFRYAHVPLVLGPDGRRLAKRDGAVTVDDLAARGVGPDRILQILASRLGVVLEPGERASDLVTRFRPDSLPREPWSFVPNDL